jgi:Tfp pilus assembly protein PilO
VTGVDNAAAVQVGLALLLGLLVVALTLLVLSILGRVANQARQAERRVERVTSRLESERINLGVRLRAIRDALDDRSRAVAELERRLTRQEHG